MFHGGELAKRWGDELEEEGGQEVPSNDVGWPSPPDQVRKFSGEENNIQKGLRKVGIELSQGSRPLLDVLGESLVGVVDSGVDVGDLVENHVLDVRLVEVGGQLGPEAKGDLFVQELNVGVHEGCWEGKETQRGNPLKEKVLVQLCDGFDNSAIHHGNVNGEECSDDQIQSENDEISQQWGFPCWEDNFQQNQNSFEKQIVDISFPALFQPTSPHFSNFEISLTFFLAPGAPLTLPEDEEFLTWSK